VSAIGGIYNLDGAPLDERLLLAFAQRLAERGPDGGGHFKSGPLAMVYRAFHTNRESRLESQPLVSCGGHVLCWNGRLDNREELISLLRDRLCSDDTDVAIVMAAYLKWGFDFLSRVIGDFALSLWDPISRILILGRDVIGSHDLYYHRNERRIIWSTDLGLVVDLSEIELQVNDDYIAGYLSRPAKPWQTPFKNIDAVPPAHAVVLKNDAVQISRFWGLDPNHQIRYKTDAEYEEHFRHVFREAVKCCLRSDRPVWSDLSGGLDSSSIVCMAEQLIKNGEAEAPLLETVSCIRDESPSSNELKFIRCVEERIGREGHHLLESAFPILSPSASEPSIIPNPLDIFVSLHREINRLMGQSGARVRLCGNGGDQILNSASDPSPELTDLLVQGHLLQLHHSLCTWSRDRKRPYFNLLWQDAVLPVLPRKLRVALKHGPLKRLPDWHDPQFVRRTNLRDLMLGPRDAFGFRLPSSRDQAISFLGTVNGLSVGYLRVLQNVEIRLPFLHRPLVEFMQAIPRAQRMRPGETRSLQRRALRDLLPQKILERKGKGNPAEAVSRALAREYRRAHSLLSDSYVARYGYVNQQALMAAFERSRYVDKYAGEILRILPLEFWLRSLEHRRLRAKMNTAAIGSPEARLAAVG
jgi:asparagine synthase (glutamine-hydrolysing)